LTELTDTYDDTNTPTPPQDDPAERSVLGAMLLSKDAIADVVEVLRGHDFYRPAHEIIYDTVLDLYGAGEPADPVTVASRLVNAGQITQIGGPAYLHTLIAEVPSTAGARSYAEAVRTAATLRALTMAGTRILQIGHRRSGAASETAEDAVTAAHAALDDATGARKASDCRPLGMLVEEVIDIVEAAGCHNMTMQGIPTGFADLDRLTHGLHPGQLVVIAARPAIGKSTLALDFARSAAMSKLTTVLFSLEMSAQEVTMRFLSAQARVGLQKLRTGAVEDSDWIRIAEKIAELQDAPLFIDDSPNMSLPEIRAKCRRLKQRNDLKLIIVDYLQLMTSGRRVESRQQEVSEFSRTLKLLAKELGVPVVALSQLNRGPEQRADRRPLLSDLRESGAIEQDADLVILLHREDAYDRESPRAGEADLIVAKHRNGPTDTVTVAFQGHYSRFVDMAEG
jgi:replicative DNA helicase